MGRRLVIKTIFICMGVFLIISSIAFTYITKKYPLDLEKHVSVLAAAVDINKGDIIEEKHIIKKYIQQSASNDVMETDIEKIVGKKAITKINKSDYIREDAFIAKKSWFKEDERIIILPVSIEERLANLIHKGSYIDIRIKRDSNAIAEIILSKVKVEDMLDEYGVSISLNNALNSQIAYMELILDNAERQKIYNATMSGKLIYELYCDETQKPAN